MSNKVSVVVGLEGGLLDYVKCWTETSDAEKDADRLAKAYEIKPTPKELAEDSNAAWHNEDFDVYVEESDMGLSNKGETKCTKCGDKTLQVCASCGYPFSLCNCEFWNDMVENDHAPENSKER